MCAGRIFAPGTVSGVGDRDCGEGGGERDEDHLRDVEDESCDACQFGGSRPVGRGRLWNRVVVFVS